LKDFNQERGSFKYLHKDYLGSVLAISDEEGNLVEEAHFGAFGKYSGSIELLGRGYTSHEHFEDVGIIHMNGRLYDPLLRRFLNADENIQDPYNTQNYNKYGYVYNNPLLASDPTGEFLFFVFLAKLVGDLLASIIIGAVIGLAAYTLTTVIMGQKWNIGGALKSMFWGAVGGAITFGVGSIFSNTTGTLTTLGNTLKKSLGDFGLALVKAGTHAVSQGLLSLVQGDKFLSGAAAGFFGSLGASAFDKVFPTFAKSAGGTIAFGALAGGIGAELTGGNFWQGAIIGATVATLNDLAHRKFSRPEKEVSAIRKKMYELYGGPGDGDKGKAKNTSYSVTYKKNDILGRIGNQFLGEIAFTRSSGSTYGSGNFGVIFSDGSKIPTYNMTVSGGLFPDLSISFEKMLGVTGISLESSFLGIAVSTGISQGVFNFEVSYKSGEHFNSLGVEYKHGNFRLPPPPKNMPMPVFFGPMGISPFPIIPIP
jgi:RHS repeat-associated protein